MLMESPSFKFLCCAFVINIAALLVCCVIEVSLIKNNFSVLCLETHMSKFCFEPGCQLFREISLLMCPGEDFSLHRMIMAF